MEFSHYTDPAARTASDLVNLYGDGDPGPDEVRAVLRPSHHSVDSLGAEEVVELGVLAARLRQAFEASDAATGIAVLNGLLAEAEVRPTISTHDGRAPHLHFTRAEAPLVQRVMANTAMALAVVLCNHGPERLGACPAAGCRHVFVDTSRNAGRRFCSDACANRTNVAAHRARTRAAG